MIPVPSREITIEERLRLRRYNRDFTKITSWFQHVGSDEGSRWVQTVCIRTSYPTVRLGI